MGVGVDANEDGTTQCTADELLYLARNKLHHLSACAGTFAGVSVQHCVSGLECLLVYARCQRTNRDHVKSLLAATFAI